MSDAKSVAITLATEQELFNHEIESAESDTILQSSNGHPPAESEQIEEHAASSSESSMPGPEDSTLPSPTGDPFLLPEESEEIPTSSKLAEIALSQIESLRSYHSDVVNDQAPEAVHKMRVTTRRLQASLDLLQSNGDEFHIRKLKRKLRKWRRVLSVIRNYDVFLNIIEKEVAGRKTRTKKRFDLLESAFEERRAQIAKESNDYLKHIDIEKLAVSLGLSSPKSGDGEKSNADEKKKLIFDKQRISLRAAERLEQRLAEFLALALQAHPTTDPADLHQLRIAAKRLRYLLETVSEMGFGDASKALHWLRSLQDRIGDWHDLHAIEEETVSIAARRKFIAANLIDAIEMLQAAAHLKKKKEKLVTRLFPVKVPRTITATSLKLAKSLRKQATA